MHILLTNDDGFFAPGLQALYRALLEEPGYVVSIVAPESQRSACGHAITLFDPLFVVEHPVEGNGKGFAVRGTPSDCVKLAIQAELVPKPDWVISGINLGPNLGTDVFYSGTVSAAMEGVLAGVPAIAASLASFEYTDFDPSAKWLAEFLKQEGRSHQDGLLNINFPGQPRETWQGVRVVRLGTAVYNDVFESRIDPHGRRYFWQGGTLSVERKTNTDLAAIAQGSISITPMHSDLTDYPKLKEWGLKSLV
ncbi:MAG: 5'/3'-nucleotidase SurE [Desulfitobacteriaceae bacterium]|nr:5'/3'-nucleotidase SurE [Desulfitobacteriaceae bacterium]MDI6912818.1 5'/3'-nucleotidase SurE [Desulfitobacteriaceae bacterium]